MTCSDQPLLLVLYPLHLLWQWLFSWSVCAVMSYRLFIKTGALAQEPITTILNQYKSLSSTISVWSGKSPLSPCQLWFIRSHCLLTVSTVLSAPLPPVHLSPIILSRGQLAPSITFTCVAGLCTFMSDGSEAALTVRDHKHWKERQEKGQECCHHMEVERRPRANSGVFFLPSSWDCDHTFLTYQSLFSDVNGPHSLLYSRRMSYQRLMCLRAELQLTT